MNATGFIRGLLSKNYSNEQFIIHVGEVIEQQLKERDGAYWVNIIKLKDYIFIVKNGDKDYWLEMTEEELAALQDQSPFSLDKRIWLELEQQGLEIVFGYGNYLERVLGRG